MAASGVPAQGPKSKTQLGVRGVFTYYDRDSDVATANDLAAYIVQRIGPASPMKINRLAYLCQAASIAVDGHLLFEGEIHAGPTGPIPLELRLEHSGKAVIDHIPDARTALLDRQARKVVDAVVGRFGRFDEHTLNAITCNGPWKEARQRKPIARRDDPVIDPVKLGPYWRNLMTALSARRKTDDA